MNKTFDLDSQVNSELQSLDDEWRKNYKIKSHNNAGLF